MTTTVLIHKYRYIVTGIKGKQRAKYDSIIVKTNIVKVIPNEYGLN